MKLRKTEIWALVITAVFIAAAAGYQAGLRRGVPDFQVVTERQTAEEAETRLPPEAPEQDAGGDAGTETGLVDLNTATAEELKTLSGVGDVLAERIIAYRTRHGGFSRAEEIQNVSGIGSAVYEANRDRLTVANPR